VMLWFRMLAKACKGTCAFANKVAETFVVLPYPRYLPKGIATFLFYRSVEEGERSVLQGPLGLALWKEVRGELEIVIRGGIPGQPQLWVRLDDDDGAGDEDAIGSGVSND